MACIFRGLGVIASIFLFLFSGGEQYVGLFFVKVKYMVQVLVREFFYFCYVLFLVIRLFLVLMFRFGRVNFQDGWIFKVGEVVCEIQMCLLFSRRSSGVVREGEVFLCREEICFFAGRVFRGGARSRQSVVLFWVLWLGFFGRIEDLFTGKQCIKFKFFY